MAEGYMDQKRLVSLDALRGFDMFLLIGSGEIGGAGILGSLLVMFDNPLAKTLYEQLQYSSWGGEVNLKGLVRPLFIFIVGVAMPYAFSKRLSCGGSKRQLYSHITRRTAILFLLGMIAGGHLLSFDLSQIYICNNVLEEIAVGYFVASVIMLNFNVREQLAAMVVLLLGYWALLTWVPVPGYGAGVLTPEGNLARYVDNIVLGGFRPVQWNFTWALSLPFASSFTVMLGVMAGHLLRSTKSPMAKFGCLLAAALGCLGLSLIWRHWYPVIGDIGTGTWVLSTGGFSLGLLGLFYLVIDVWGLQKWAFFFVVIGSNSIAVYMAAHLFDFRNIGNIFVGGLTQWVEPWNDFVQALAAFTVIWLILFWMYRKKSFIKV